VRYQVICGDCIDILPGIPAESIDAVISDPPYPCVKRSYGYWTESEWWDLMMTVCKEVRRVLKPTGSAVFILQPNSRHVGEMRSWLWRFMLWVTEEWNQVQDFWWWNIAPIPTVHATHYKLARPSIKACVWCGPADCYRDQEKVLWTEAQASRARYANARAGRKQMPSGHGRDMTKIGLAAKRRGGGVTPFNLLPMANSDPRNSAGAYGHGAGTPFELAHWWIRYICPPGGTVLDPFFGTGTMGLAALQSDCKIIGIEKESAYCEIAEQHLQEEAGKLRLW